MPDHLCIANIVNKEANGVIPVGQLNRQLIKQRFYESELYI